MPSALVSVLIIVFAFDFAPAPGGVRAAISFYLFTWVLVRVASFACGDLSVSCVVVDYLWVCALALGAFKKGPDLRPKSSYRSPNNRKPSPIFPGPIPRNLVPVLV